MDTVNITPALSTQEVTEVAAAVQVLVEARNGVVNAARSTGEVIKWYADAISSIFGAEWYELKGAAKKPINTERAQFVAAMTGAGFKKATIDVYWQRVKEAAGYVTVGNRVKGASDVDSKNLDDLRTLINRIFKAEEDGTDTQWSDEKAGLIDIFTRMGGDENKLG